jgi:GR25 family glycosyltransferase involved in LPS biosynthesis
MWYQNRTHYSSKVAVDISHFRLWQRLAAADQPAIILEDDVKLTGPSFRKDLLTVLNELPQVG